VAATRETLDRVLHTGEEFPQGSGGFEKYPVRPITEPAANGGFLREGTRRRNVRQSGVATKWQRMARWRRSSARNSGQPVSCRPQGSPTLLGVTLRPAPLSLVASCPSPDAEHAEAAARSAASKSSCSRSHTHARCHSSIATHPSAGDRVEPPPKPSLAGSAATRSRCRARTGSPAAPADRQPLAARIAEAPLDLRQQRLDPLPQLVRHDPRCASHRYPSKLEDKYRRRSSSANRSLRFGASS
jgi:hypothetical protein